MRNNRIRRVQLFVSSIVLLAIVLAYFLLDMPGWLLLIFAVAAYLLVDSSKLVTAAMMDYRLLTEQEIVEDQKHAKQIEERKQEMEKAKALKRRNKRV
ncbi:hypothetical protein LJC55_00715 [Eubacteriales bacterium OttesenSCG-928-N14]|nr:hypothetical protein [Eubacteriales bacterium OttesenSCG-928-N14]